MDCDFIMCYNNRSILSASGGPERVENAPDSPHACQIVRMPETPVTNPPLAELHRLHIA
jgi:hypothetical protein